MTVFSCIIQNPVGMVLSFALFSYVEPQVIYPLTYTVLNRDTNKVKCQIKKEKKMPMFFENFIIIFIKKKSTKHFLETRRPKKL